MPLDPLTASAIIGGTAGLLTTGVNWIKDAFTYNKNLKQWQRENEYNSPVQQMKRLEAAGLNPHLVYGNGNATVKSASSPSLSMSDAKSPIGFAPMLSYFQDMKLKAAQADNIAANTQLAKENAITQSVNRALMAQEKINKSLTANSIMLDNTYKAIQNDFYRQRNPFLIKQADYQTQLYEQNLKNAKQANDKVELEMKNLRVDKLLKDIEYDMKSKGFSFSDPWYIRKGYGLYRNWDKVENYQREYNITPENIWGNGTRVR